MTSPSKFIRQEVRPVGFEPTTAGLEGLRLFHQWTYISVSTLESIFSQKILLLNRFSNIDCHLPFLATEVSLMICTLNPLLVNSSARSCSTREFFPVIVILINLLVVILFYPSNHLIDEL